MYDDMPQQPDGQWSAVARNGILPGFGWESDLMNGDDGDYFTEHIIATADNAETTSVIDQAQAQWRDLFPDATEQDRHMFMAGVIAMHAWVQWTCMQCPTPEIHKDNLRTSLLNTCNRIVTVVHDLPSKVEVSDA